LEARSARPSSGTSLLSSLPPSATEASSLVESVPPEASSPAANACLHSSIIIESLAELHEPAPGTYAPVIVHSPLPAPEVVASPVPGKVSPAPVLAASPGPATTAKKEVETQLERDVRRTLQSAARSQPYRDVVARIRLDMPAGLAASIAVVGFGEMSPTHDLALHLAAVLGEAAPTALVDANLARGTLTREFERVAATGLSDLLSGQTANLEPTPTALGNVALVPCGTVSAKVTDVPDDRFAALLRRLGVRHSHTIVDAGRVEDRAAPAIARLCDGAYFVIRLGVVEAARAERALKDYRAAGARVLGCIALG
jgi:Mrp family chromosome partitioning ATPase